MLKKIRLLLSFLIPGLLIAWIILEKPWQELLPRLSGRHPWPVLLAVLINFAVSFPIKTIKWRSLLLKPPPFLSIFGAVLEGAAANIIIGFGMNDVVRSYRLRPDGARFSDDMGAALTDRICEYLALMVIFCAAIVLDYIPPFWAVLPVLYIVFLVLMMYFQESFTFWFKRFARLHAFLVRLGEGLKWDSILGLTFLSLLNWLVELILLHLVLGFLGLPDGPMVAMMVLIGINIAISVPGPPANIGTFEAGAVAALGLAGVEPVAALSFGIFYHLVHALPVALAGGIIWVVKDVVRSRAERLRKESLEN